MHSQGLDLADCIGMESCLDLMSDADDDTRKNNWLCGGGGGDERRGIIRRGSTKDDRRRKEIRKYPPPLPSLARTENLPSHMPWVLKRYHTSDGRLIMREEKVRHHEHFRAHRANGRLTLQLIPLDGGNASIASNEEGDEETKENHVDVGCDDELGEDVVVVGSEMIVLEEERNYKLVADEEGIQKLPIISGEGHGATVLGGAAGGKAKSKCYNLINTMRSGPCNYEILFPAINPVHV